MKTGVKATLLFVVLAGFLALFFWWIVSALGAIGGFNMPLAGWIAMILGIVLSIVVGVGLMAMVFHSSRRGYDEAPQMERASQRQEADTIARR